MKYSNIRRMVIKMVVSKAPNNAREKAVFVQGVVLVGGGPRSTVESSSERVEQSRTS